MPSIKIDDILAALILSLAMMRRIEVRTASPEQNPRVAPEDFETWRALALRAYDQTGLASALKVVSSVGWFALCVQLGLGYPWLQLGGLAVFVTWIVLLIWAWKIGTDARHLRLSLGIELRRRSKTST